MIKIIYDLCTPTKDRRPTTADDVYNDIHVEKLSNEKDLKDVLNKLTWLDEDEVAEDLGKDIDDISIEEYAEASLGYLDDPGDGSPNVLYLNINGKEIPGSLTYECLKNLNLENATKEDVVKAIIGESEDDFYESYHYKKSYSLQEALHELRTTKKSLDEDVNQNAKAKYNKNLKESLQDIEDNLDYIHSVEISANGVGRYWYLTEDDECGLYKAIDLVKEFINDINKLVEPYKQFMFEALQKNLFNINIGYYVDKLEGEDNQYDDDDEYDDDGYGVDYYIDDDDNYHEIDHDNFDYYDTHNDDMSFTILEFLKQANINIKFPQYNKPLPKSKFYRNPTQTAKLIDQCIAKIFDMD